MNAEEEERIEAVNRYIGAINRQIFVETPVVVIDEEKEKTHKTGYTSLYNKLFGGKHQK